MKRMPHILPEVEAVMRIPYSSQKEGMEKGSSVQWAVIGDKSLESQVFILATLRIFKT